MNKIMPYLLLSLFCINIFGAPIGELVHMAAHFVESGNMQWSMHHHDHSNSLAGVDGHHSHGEAEGDHTHSKLIGFMLEVFDVNPTSAPFTGLQHLNLLMLALDGIVDECLLDIGIHFNQPQIINTSTTILKPINQDVPYPPPRFFA